MPINMIAVPMAQRALPDIPRMGVTLATGGPGTATAPAEFWSDASSCCLAPSLARPRCRRAGRQGGDPGNLRSFSLLTALLIFPEVDSGLLGPAKVWTKGATVCVHMATNRVGVRELRQNLSRYLRRVALGERIEVTERGKPVAVLAPASESQSALQRLVASGRASSPEGDLLDLAPPRGPVTAKGTDALRDLREDRT
jgi:prevent-host-death family protein